MVPRTGPRMELRPPIRMAMKHRTDRSSVNASGVGGDRRFGQAARSDSGTCHQRFTSSERHPIPPAFALSHCRHLLCVRCWALYRRLERPGNSSVGCISTRGYSPPVTSAVLLERAPSPLFPGLSLHCPGVLGSRETKVLRDFRHRHDGTLHEEADDFRRLEAIQKVPRSLSSTLVRRVHAV